MSALWTQTPARPYRCPVCNGKGIVPTGFYNVGPVASATGTTPEKCRSCNGTGLVR